jgi:hypothetical protein
MRTTIAQLDDHAGRILLDAPELAVHVAKLDDTEHEL